MADDKDQIEDNIFDEGDFEEDGTADVVRSFLKDLNDEDAADDDGGFDQPLSAKGGDEPDVVSPEKGRDLVDDAEMAKAKGKNPDSDKADAKAEADGEDAPKGDDANSKPEDAKADAAPDLTKADTSALLDGVPDDRKAELSRRLAASDDTMSVFEDPFLQNQMSQFGGSPKEVVSRLTDLASFAQEKPDEYLSWFASQSASDPTKVGDVLNAAAQRLGFKVVPDIGDAGEDDEFKDPETLRLEAENKHLRAQVSGTGEFGPDTTERRTARQVQQELAQFTSEKDESGNPKRPFFEKLQPQIAKMASAQVAKTGQPATLEDLSRFYDQAAEEMRASFGQQVTPDPNPPASAAQPEGDVAKQLQEQAAAAEKAKAASKSIDGTGQGATRRPGLPDTASLDDVIRHFANTD